MTEHILEIQTGKHKGRKVKLKDQEIIIGRDEAAKIRIASKDVSRHHCEIKRRDNKLYVTDLKSSNGTFVNGRPVLNETELLPGNTLTIGPMTFQLMGDESGQKQRKANVAVGLKANVDQRLSDDDIASWLVDDIMEEPTSDTTIIKNSSSPVPAPHIEPKEPKREFDSVADEAKDIIRRHLEQLAEK